MNRNTIMLQIVLFTGLLTYSITSHAYLDPGTGSLILQGLLAAIAGALVTANIYWLKIKDYWQRLTNRINSSDDELEQSQPADSKDID